MRATCWFGLVLLVLLLGAPAVQAGEGEAHAAAAAAEKALEALKLRMEARIKEGELLARAGRIEEALEAYRSVGALYDAGMSQLQALLAALGQAAPAAQPPRPAAARDEPFEGGAFAGRPERGPAGGSGARIDDALRWLAAHQNPSGKWGAIDFAGWCDGSPVGDAAKRPDGLGKAHYDVGVTGLSLLAYLGAGYTNRGHHPHCKAVARGLRFLQQSQDPEGCFGPRTVQQYMYNHAIATLAVIEAYAMTRSEIWKGPAQKALDFAAKARNPYMAWRYGVRPGDNDTSLTAWMIMAFKSAMLVNAADLRAGRKATFEVDEAAFRGARAWLDKVTDPDVGRVGYNARGSSPARAQELVDRFPAEKSESMTAAGVLMRVFMGEDPRRSALVRKGADLCLRRLPTWNGADGSIDMYYWYFGTLAMYQVGGKHWQAWNKALRSAVMDTQRRDTQACLYKGSWDPVGAWGPYGGRVMATALMTLCLQVADRHARVFGAK